MALSPGLAGVSPPTPPAHREPAAKGATPMNGRLPAPRHVLLTTAFLFALGGAACLSDGGGRRPSGSGDPTGGAAGEEDPGDTGGKTGGYVSHDAAPTGGEDTGGSLGTGGSRGTGGSTGNGG